MQSEQKDHLLLLSFQKHTFLPALPYKRGGFQQYYNQVAPDITEVGNGPGSGVALLLSHRWIAPTVSIVHEY